MARKTFEAKFKPGKKGVFAISLVNDPAMESLFVALGKQKVFKFKTIDEEQRLLVGLAMQPDKLIPRVDQVTGEEYDLVFRSDTIRELSYNFFKQKAQDKSKLEHLDWIDGVNVVESWIKTDEKHDKSHAFGFNNPVGSWFVAMKIDNPSIWEHYVKTGKVQGFSVDAMLSLQEIELSNNKEMKNILQLLKKAKPEPTTEPKPETFGSIKSGEVDIMFDGETLAQGQKVWAMGEDGNRIAIPAGEYELENGMKITVNENSEVAEMVEMNQEPDAGTPDAGTPAPAPAAAPGLSESEIQKIKSVLVKFEVDENQTDVFEQVAELSAQNTALQKKVKELLTVDAKLAELTAANEKLVERIEELESQPAGTPIAPRAENTTPAVELNATGRILTKLRKAK